MAPGMTKFLSTKKSAERLGLVPINPTRYSVYLALVIVPMMAAWKRCKGE